ncbi:TonB-dependent receptor domain-containing protein [Maribellus maritimus]|uniref:TonB-dependent receptor domain-containing protein n=1 Tax=Maribellus maritimus TaxID=2870838 RepID=UPI001EEAD258|nr:TonB-dependent receptor [Maribellus maritimus]MCG6187331.1 TonB-dependent receptor [Maribellus maritimus]
MKKISQSLKRTIFFVAVFFCSLSLFSNNDTPLDFEIKGVVSDSVSGDGISYVTISIQTEKGVIKRLASDASGKFSFSLDSVGTYDVIFHSIGYQMQVKQIKLNKSATKIDLGTIPLKHSVEQIGEVTVAVQKPLIRTEPDKIVYSLETDPESKTSNVLEMLRKVPLLSVDGEDNIQMKGSSNFKILINGKSSAMVSQNPKEVLRSLPASSVKDIEVITDPSSKYEAEGTAGIINIITNKNQIEGFLARGSGSIDSRGGYSGGLYATSKINKFGFSLNYNYNKYLQPKSESESYRENYQSTTNRYTETEGYNKSTGRYNFLMGEASYEIDTLNLISLSFFGYGGDFSSPGYSLTNDYNTDRNLTRQFENTIKSSNGFGSLSGNIDYQRTFDKPDKTFTVSYRLDNSPRNTDYKNVINGILDYPSYQQKTTNDAVGREHTFQLDYYDPITKVHQIETGIKYILRQNKSNSDIFRFNEDTDEWERDLARINDLDYDQHVVGIYGGYVLKLKKINIKTGLRAEITKNDGVFISTSDTTFTNRMFNLIPYVTLSKNLKNGQNVKLSYTQRLSRPGIWYLNPFYDDSDPLNVRYGNPKLDSEIRHTFNFTYGKFSPKFNFNLNLSSAFENNSITSITTLQPDGVSVTTYENIGKYQDYSGYIYGMVKVGKKLSFNSNIGAYYTILESSGGQNLSNEGFRYRGTLSMRYNIWENGTFSVYGGMYSPSIMLQGESSSYNYSSVSFSQSFFDKKLQVNFSVSDPFRERMEFSSTLKDDTFYRKSKNYNYNRTFRVYISYQIGQMKEQIKKARRSIKNTDLKSGGDAGQGASAGGGQ